MNFGGVFVPPKLNKPSIDGNSQILDSNVAEAVVEKLPHCIV